MTCRGGACPALYPSVQGFALPSVPCLGGASPAPADRVVTPAKAGVQQILRGVYLSGRARFFASLRMTGEGLRVTGNRLRMTSEGGRAAALRPSLVKQFQLCNLCKNVADEDMRFLDPGSGLRRDTNAVA